VENWTKTARTILWFNLKRKRTFILLMKKLSMSSWVKWWV